MTGLVLLMLLGGADSLAPVKVNGLSLKAPSSWQSSAGDDDSRGWSDPAGDGDFQISVYPVDPVRTAAVCVDELEKAVAASAGTGFERIKVGTQPAARKVTIDYLGDSPDAGKTDANKVSTITVVGCNGKTKWLLTATSKASKSPRFGVLFKAIVDSISYGK